jgi:AcrR family transcriptional regulator
MRVTAETKEATRQRILEAAEQHFARHGFHATTTRDLAAAAGIATGTLFNYFPTKEALAQCLVGQACAAADATFAAPPAEPLSFEEELFAYVAANLRKLKSFRKYLPAVLETSLSPLADQQAGSASSLRTTHLEIVGQIAARHERGDSLNSVALHLYWTLYTGVLAFWASDRSPKQEDTLALLDQSLAMFVGWLMQCGPRSNALHECAGDDPSQPPSKRG